LKKKPTTIRNSTSPFERLFCKLKRLLRKLHK
jgi:hypothetical protein